MKYKSKIYARALVDLVLSEKGESEIKKKIGNFLKILEKNGDIKKAKEIISLAENLYSKKTGNKKIVLETARKVNLKNISKGIVKNGDIILEKINPELIAGVKIIINNEKQLDNSLKNKLDKVFSL
jgi:F0F1-type ATP synthase delta subunit